MTHLNPPPPLPTTPHADGFRMPGEFEPHTGCWLLFPERPDVWGIDPTPGQQAFVNVATAIAQFEPVTVAASAVSLAKARRMMPPSVKVVEIPADDAWMRDSGPTFVINDQGEVRGVDWEFNAWGGEISGLYYPWDQDNRVAQQVLTQLRFPRYKTELVNEGGAIHVDGEGTLITTRSVILNKNRNPGMTEKAAEKIFRDYLGATKVIWLDVPDEDETDGHVDGVCAFARPGVLLISWEEDDPAYHDVYNQLAAVTDAKGRKFELIKLPVAQIPPISRAEAAAVAPMGGTYPRQTGDYVWGGYINFYIANGGIVYPLFDVPEDQIAHDILQAAFPDRKIVGVSGARQISMCGGIIHCITQQQPLPNNG